MSIFCQLGGTWCSRPLKPNNMDVANVNMERCECNTVKGNCEQEKDFEQPRGNEEFYLKDVCSHKDQENVEIYKKRAFLCGHCI